MHDSFVVAAQVAKSLASELVSRRLVACVNTVLGVESTYWWGGKVQTDQELLLIMKTTSATMPRLITAVQELHPYDVPEVIALPVVAGSDPYLQWVRTNVHHSPPVAP